MSKIRVLIVDDSALVRKLLTEMLNSDPEIEVIGTAIDPYVAWDKIKQLNPDVITLDVEMPRMNGLFFLRNLMRLRPMPVVMVSKFTAAGAEVTQDALAAGAVDFITKPKVGLAQDLENYTDELIEKVKIAARAHVRSFASKSQFVAAKHNADSILPKPVSRSHFRTTDQIVAIGSSTGGTEAIAAILSAMPADAPAMVVTQHIPEAFSGPFAKRMDVASAMKVFEALDGQPILPGHAYIAPGNRHLLIKRNGARYVCSLDNGTPVNRHRPSVDVLFRSVAANAGSNALGIILTGMGSDGALGLLEMREMGALTLAQDEASSVVWGMPGEAVKLGASMRVLSLDDIIQTIRNYPKGLHKGSNVMNHPTFNLPRSYDYVTN